MPLLGCYFEEMSLQRLNDERKLVLIPRKSTGNGSYVVEKKYPGGDGQGKDDPKEFLFPSSKLGVGTFTRPQEE